eukprot:CAMPEP_0175468558 /NCGR_PEP_ID=MMETSP0095-20121207/71890_1 /TAXON_ID=311494 /ORGANISM="Alexandrium monilatum, Strain CCMP3105" /LENGTH=58 /DNA_ID=CAMNT_0016769951 /DNA_START=120 /DNA_END=293 /DNA_ORIENTATION=+
MQMARFGGAVSVAPPEAARRSSAQSAPASAKDAVHSLGRGGGRLSNALSTLYVWPKKL